MGLYPVCRESFLQPQGIAPSVVLINKWVYVFKQFHYVKPLHRQYFIIETYKGAIVTTSVYTPGRNGTQRHSDYPRERLLK